MELGKQKEAKVEATRNGEVAHGNTTERTDPPLNPRWPHKNKL